MIIRKTYPLILDTIELPLIYQEGIHESTKYKIKIFYYEYRKKNFFSAAKSIFLQNRFKILHLIDFQCSWVDYPFGESINSFRPDIKRLNIPMGDSISVILNPFSWHYNNNQDSWSLKSFYCFQEISTPFIQWPTTFWHTSTFHSNPLDCIASNFQYRMNSFRWFLSIHFGWLWFICIYPIHQ